MKNWVIALTLGLLLIGACSDDDKGKDVPTPVDENFTGLKFTADNGTLTIPISHSFNNGALQLNTDYQTALGDTIKFSTLIYYFSNVSLQNSAGKWINLGNYDLVDFKDASSQNITLTNVPAGTYSKIRFAIGVDSAANSTGAHEGELNPSYGMYWGWATGYVFFRVKGRCNGNKSLTFDIGGDQNLPVVELPLDGYKKYGTSITTALTFNLADIFVSPNDYSLRTNSIDIHTAIEPGAALLRDNIKTGAFTITSVQ